jgi:catechol 2,3-dioxygenase-like lactoylglutathione lyase family enzyme
MESWVGQYCIYVSDMESTLRFWKTLGLSDTSRTDLGHTLEAIVENSDKGGKLQLAQKVDGAGPIDHGNALWKLYVATNDIEKMYGDAISAGYRSVSEPERGDRWPMTVAFIEDPDGYLVELTQRHPWKDGDDTTYAWLNQYCIYVSDIAATKRFYEILGLACTSEIEIPGVLEAIMEHPEERGGKIQLAQTLGDASPIDMGTAMWKLYVHTDDCRALHQRALDGGYVEAMAPMSPPQWPVTISFLTDPDGYSVELVERHPD